MAGQPAQAAWKDREILLPGWHDQQVDSHRAVLPGESVVVCRGVVQQW